MTDPAEDAPREIKSLDDAVAWLRKQVETTIGPDLMTREERKKHYPRMPKVTLNAAEREILLAYAKTLLNSLGLLRAELALLSTNRLPAVESYLMDVLLTVFAIGQWTHFNPAEKRQAQETSKAQVKKMHDAKLPAEQVDGIICNCLRGYLKTNPQDKKKQTAKFLTGKIAPEVNAALGALGAKGMRDDSIRRRILRNGLRDKLSG